MDAITEAELLDAIEEATNAAPDQKPGWRSTAEWQVLWGCSENRVDRLLKRAYRAGILEADKRQGLNRIGVPMWVPVYRIGPQRGTLLSSGTDTGSVRGNSDNLDQ